MLLEGKISDEVRFTGLTTFVNPYSYLKLYKKNELLESFDNIHADGILMARAASNYQKKNIKRRSFDFSSVAPLVFENAVNNNLSIFLIGTTQENIELAVGKLSLFYDGINICGFRNGFFLNDSELDQCLKNICELKPDIVIAGMGAIIQESFLIKLAELEWKGAGYTCGGFFHQIAKRDLVYYPSFFDRYNLRWLYRIIDEPKLLKRYLWYYPVFIVIIFSHVYFKIE